MKKTKKEKMLADLRRKIAKAESQITYSPEVVSVKPKAEIKPAAFSVQSIIPTKTSALSIDYSQISRDLKKTLILSVAIVVALLVLKFLLKT